LVEVEADVDERLNRVASRQSSETGVLSACEDCRSGGVDRKPERRSRPVIAGGSLKRYDGSPVLVCLTSKADLRRFMLIPPVMPVSLRSFVQMLNIYA
jgi:hypothetical protein